MQVLVQNSSPSTQWPYEYGVLVQTQNITIIEGSQALLIARAEFSANSTESVVKLRLGWKASEPAGEAALGMSSSTRLTADYEQTIQIHEWFGNLNPGVYTFYLLYDAQSVIPETTASNGLITVIIF